MQYNNNIVKKHSRIDNIIDELRNIILAKINGIQNKLKFLSSDLDIIKSNIYLKNVLKFELKEDIYINFDKKSNNTFKIININLTNLRKGDIIEINLKC